MKLNNEQNSIVNEIVKVMSATIKAGEKLVQLLNTAKELEVPTVEIAKALVQSKVYKNVATAQASLSRAKSLMEAKKPSVIEALSLDDRIDNLIEKLHKLATKARLGVDTLEERIETLFSELDKPKAKVEA